MSSDDSSSNDSNYFYNPSVPAAYIFAVLFGISIILHTYQIFRYRTVFMVVLLVGLWMEFIGYITRIISIKNPGPDWSIIVSQVGLIVAPAFMAAQEYMVIGRVMAYVGSKYSVIGHGKITKLFVTADVLAILTQAGGGAMLTGNDLNQLETAKKILLGGLALQVVTFGIFLFVAVAFDIRTSRSADLKPYAEKMRRLRGLWIAFYVTAVLITGRSIYRTAEFADVSFTAGADDPQGYAITHEWLFYVFDSVPIWISVMVLSFYHPGRFLPNKKGFRIDGSFEEQPGRRRFLCCGRRNSRTPRTAASQPEVPLEHV